VRAQDADVTDDKKLRYTFVDAEPEEGIKLFTITDEVDTNRGIITVAEDLTDKWGVYRLNVMVSGYFKRKVNLFIMLYRCNDK
jgi:hypothetical protein